MAKIRQRQRWPSVKLGRAWGGRHPYKYYSDIPRQIRQADIHARLGDEEAADEITRLSQRPGDQD